MPISSVSALLALQPLIDALWERRGEMNPQCSPDEIQAIEDVVTACSVKTVYTFFRRFMRGKPERVMLV